MAGEWRTVTLGEVIELKRGYDLPARDRRPGPYPIVSSSGVSDFHFEPKVQGPGVVTGRYGTLGEVFYVKEDFWPLNTALYVRDFKGNNPLFISYFLKTLNFLAFSDKAAVPGLNRNHLHSATVRIPNVTVQRAIACILGSLDDKIELNRRMNRTLEEMARAIFKSWFIDFDPVRAKAAVRREHPKWTDDQVSRAACPKLKPEIARLFPDSFEDSELGKIPKGWRVGTLDNVAEHRRRSVQPDSIAPNTRYIALEHMPRQCIALSEWNLAAGIESNKFEFRKGEILFGKLRPYFHKVGVAPVDGVCSTDIVVVVPKTPEWLAFVLGHVSSVEFVEYTNAGSTGTKMPRTSWAEMARYEIARPPLPVAQVFTEIVRPSIGRIIEGIHESRTLAALRDVLLPKLVSGQLRIPDAERIVQRKV